MQIFARIRARHLVRDLYKAILGREPDSEGARAYESLIRKIGPERAIPKMLRAFRRSAEYSKRADALAVSHINATLASQGNQLINGYPVGHLVSLGSFCLPGLIFRDNGLRRYSLPFDWIFSTPPMVRDCLADDFSAFLDRRYYRSVSHERKEPGAEHELYKARYDLPTLFAHRDPTREADYLHLTRCVARFRQLMRSEDAKLILIIGRENHDLTKEFPLLLEAITRTTTNFVLLGVELLNPTEPGLSALVPLARTGNHALYRFTPSSYNAIGGFLPDKLDEWTLLRLIYRYQLALKDSPWTEGEPSQPVQHVLSDSIGSREPEHA
jgi:Putative papain-like cysteine peptidase (DUF1796)